ncbi:MAG: hypothetical protein ABSC95_23965 [Acetobacteraceae bacterium]
MPHNNLGRLNTYERHVIQLVSRGEPVAFREDGGRKPQIRAELIRSLLVGLATDAEPDTGSFRPPGVRISGACIEGALQLADSTRLTRPLPVLALETCDIAGNIDLSAAHLSRFSLAGSRVRCVSLRSARIDGPFNFSDVSGFDVDECWIDARAASIGGDVLGERAMLRAPATRPSEQLRDGDRRAALWLAGATIDGSVRLVDGFSADGGVSIDAARVRGDVRLDGGAMCSAEADAFNARSATIGGVLYIRRCVLYGVAWLMGLRTGGSVEFSDTTIYGTIDPWEVPDVNPRERNDPHWARKALVIADTDVGASLRLTRGFVAHGSVNLAASRVRGSIDATGAEFHNMVESGRARALDATNAEIGANLLLDGAIATGRIDIAGARIGGKLSFLDARLSNCTTDRGGQALEAANVSVGGNAEFGREQRGSAWFGVVNLTGAQIGGDLSFAHSSVQNATPGGEGVAIVARRAKVQGSIALDNGFTAEGAVLLSGTTIGRDLRIDDATIRNPGQSAIYAKDIEIGDDLTLRKSTIEGHLRFARIVVTGAVVWDQLTLGLAADPPDDRGSRLDLMHARIGARLICGDVTCVSPCRIDLTGMRVTTIEVAHPNGWGRVTRATRSSDDYYPLRLDGLLYERIALPNLGNYNPSHALRRRAGIPTGATRWFGPPRRALSDRLIDWLLRCSQAPDVRFDERPAGNGTWETYFRPQPFRHLAGVLRAQGLEEEAHSVAIAEQWATPRTWWSYPVYWSYGVCFGFAMRPRRALITLIVYVALGTGLAWLALHNGWMVETPQIAASTYTVEQDLAKRAFALAPDPSKTRPHLACIDLSELPDAIVYAADTVLPFIPLRQETKCELAPDWHYLRLLRAGYTVLGWIVTSLALLTFSGIIRRFDIEPG